MKHYKYKKLDKYSLRTLSDDEIYFSDVAGFNDPFDSRIVFDISDYTSELIDEASKKAAIKLNKSPGELKKLVYDTLGKNEISRIEEKVSLKTQEKILQSIRIYCVSTINNDILMWSHYSDNHKGICYEFDFSQSSLPEPLPAVYQDEYPKININATAEEYSQALRVKFTSWKYENEYRIIKQFRAGEPTVIKLENNVLSGLIMGCEMTENDKKHILELNEQRSKPIDLYEAVKNNKSFIIDLKKVS